MENRSCYRSDASNTIFPSPAAIDPHIVRIPTDVNGVLSDPWIYFATMRHATQKISGQFFYIRRIQRIQRTYFLAIKLQIFAHSMGNLLKKKRKKKTIRSRVEESEQYFFIYVVGAFVAFLFPPTNNEYWFYLFVENTEQIITTFDVLYCSIISLINFHKGWLTIFR